jgi:hypothetical protein
MVGSILWITAVVVGVIGLGIAFVINARALRRDFSRRSDALRAHLENEANAVIDELFETEPSRGERRGP